MIQRTFSNMSKGQVNLTFILSTTILVIATIMVVPGIVYQTPSEIISIEDGKEKSSTEQTIEDIQSVKEFATPIVKELLADKRIKDSIRNVGKEPRWAIQIGDITNNRNQLSKAVLDLEGKIEGLKVFKEYNKGFRVVLDFGLSEVNARVREKELQNELKASSIKVSTIYLTDYCKPKHEIKQGKETRIRRSNQKLTTLECN